MVSNSTMALQGLAVVLLAAVMVLGHPAVAQQPAPSSSGAQAAPSTAPKPPSTPATEPVLPSPSGATATTPKAAQPPASQATTPGKQTAKPVKKVDLNNATLEQLKTLPTVGDAEAKKIIANRPYKSKGELVTKAGLPEGVYHAVKHKVELQTPRKPAPKK